MARGSRSVLSFSTREKIEPMKNLFLKHNTLVFLMLALSVSISNCAGGKSTWSLVELVTVGDPIENLASEVVQVKNCGMPIEKTTDCSAGTSNDLSLTSSSGVTLGTGAQFTIEGSVGTTLGIGQQSGESVKLNTPPNGLIYVYTINKVYRTVTGEVLARSSDGDKQIYNFSFHASCSIDVVAIEQVNCSGNGPAPDTQPPPPPTDIPKTDTPIPPPTSILDTPPGTILEVGQTWRQEGLTLQLVSAEISAGSSDTGPGILLLFRLTNERTQDTSIRYSGENFSAIDNQGGKLETGETNYGGWYFTFDERKLILCAACGIYLPQGEDSDFASPRIFIRADVFDTSVFEIIVNVTEISSIKNAQWRIPITH